MPVNKQTKKKVTYTKDWCSTKEDSNKILCIYGILPEEFRNWFKVPFQFWKTKVFEIDYQGKTMF